MFVRKGGRKVALLREGESEGTENLLNTPGNDPPPGNGVSIK